MAGLFDTHAHLDFPDFEADLPQLLARAREAGVERIITIGTDLESSGRAIRIAEAHPMVYAAVGWHPAHALEAPEDIREPLRRMAAHPKVVAIGETGIDHHHLPSRRTGGTEADDERYRSRQVDLFRQQLEVAAATGLNCVVHERDAFEPAIEILSPYASTVRGVFHCFSGTPERVRRILALGSLVSFTGILTFKNGANIRESLQATPRDRFMLETDCPYLAPVPHRGKRCEPAFVRNTAEMAATVTGLSLEEVLERTCRTAMDFFPKLAN